MGNKYNSPTVTLNTAFWRDDVLYVSYVDFLHPYRSEIIEQYVEEEDDYSNVCGKLVQVGGTNEC